MESKKALYAVIDQVRLAFNQMQAVADDMHADIAITAAMRAVLERLARGGPQTVPAIARARNVSRQHIQKLVDGLGAADLVDLHDNRAHKRSPLVDLTEKGRTVFAGIEKKEAAVIARLAVALADRDLGGTARTLRALTEALGGQAAATK